MKNIWTPLCFLILFAPAAMAAGTDDNAEVERFLKEKINQVTGALQQKDLPEEARKEKVSAIASALFDFPLMAKLALGKQHWFSLSETERKQFTDLFVERLKASYLNKMLRYTDENITFGPALRAGRKVQIPTYLVTGDKEISMVYKLYQPKDQWKLYDLEIQDVSLVQSYKAQFDEILKNGTPEDLLKKMEQPQ